MSFRRRFFLHSIILIKGWRWRWWLEVKRLFLWGLSHGSHRMSLRWKLGLGLVIWNWRRDELWLYLHGWHHRGRRGWCKIQTESGKLILRRISWGRGWNYTDSTRRRTHRHHIHPHIISRTRHSIQLPWILIFLLNVARLGLLNPRLVHAQILILLVLAIDELFAYAAECGVLAEHLMLDWVLDGLFFEVFDLYVVHLVLDWDSLLGRILEGF